MEVLRSGCPDPLEIIACSGASAAARFQTLTLEEFCRHSGLAAKQSPLHHKTQEPFEIRASAEMLLCIDVASRDADGGMKTRGRGGEKNVRMCCFTGVYRCGKQIFVAGKRLMHYSVRVPAAGQSFDVSHRRQRHQCCDHPVRLSSEQADHYCSCSALHGYGTAVLLHYKEQQMRKQLS